MCTLHLGSTGEVMDGMKTAWLSSVPLHADDVLHCFFVMVSFSSARKTNVNEKGSNQTQPKETDLVAKKKN